MWHREYMASCPISGTPSLHGHDKARRNCPVVIPRQVGGVWEWADLELAGCSSLPIASQPQRGPQGYRELSQRAGSPRCDGAAWRCCSALAREQLRLEPPRKFQRMGPASSRRASSVERPSSRPAPMPHAGVAAGGSPAKPKQPNGDTRHLPLSELASDDLKSLTSASASCLPNSLQSTAGIVPLGMNLRGDASPSPSHWPAAFRSQEGRYWISGPGLWNRTSSCPTPGRDRPGLI